MKARIGNRGWSTKAKPSKPVDFTALYIPGVGWKLLRNTSWVRAREISFNTLTITGPDGTLNGTGVVTRKGDCLVITA